MGADPESEDGTGGETTGVSQWGPKATSAPGRGRWTTDLVRMAGGRNPRANDQVHSRAVADDEVAAISPEAIVISWCGVDPANYRPDDEVEYWRSQDPIPRFREWLSSQGLATEEDFDQIDAAVDEQVVAAAEFADASPFPEPQELYRGVYGGVYGGVYEADKGI